MKGQTSIRMTIDGVTRTPAEWAEQPGAMCLATIERRRRFGWSDKEAVFAPKRSSSAHCVARSVFFKRPPARVVREPHPRQANPLPPTWGGYRSFPIQHLELLRRHA